MDDAVTLNEIPQTKISYMIAGWRQWADAGSISSGLPQYLIQQTNARHIGSIEPTGYYLFQIPGTHDLVRPVVRFEDGFPESLETRHNDLYYTGNAERGVVIFLGDEPHMDIDRYSNAFLSAAQSLGVRRIISLGGVYGELPYDKERMIASIYSRKELKAELTDLAVNLSDYQGGASIGSYLCHHASKRDIEFVGLYAFVPTYEFTSFAQSASSIRIENDFMAWLGVMKRINHMLGLHFDLRDLEDKSQHLRDVVAARIDELDSSAPQLGVREYINQLAANFEEVEFDPLADVWEQELRRLFDDADSEDND